MIRNSDFWELEKDAPLMVLNHGFLQKDTDVLCERVRGWPALAGVTTVPAVTLPEAEEIDRIFVADAERTFKTEANKQKFIKLLSYLKKNFGDYAQGLGYVSSFFMLTMDEPSAIALLTTINNNYIAGFWKHEAFKFATDAYVFQELLKTYQPEVLEHLTKHMVDPSTFCQKWFVGLCVHVLPLEHLFNFFELFLTRGHKFLMQFGLSFVEHLKPRLMAAKDTSTLFAILRLDPKIVAHDNALIAGILNDTSKYDLSALNFEELRTAAYDKHLKKRVESAKQVLDEVDEIEDCVLCEDDFPEVRCLECKINICETCHNNPPADSKHIRGHKTRPLDEEEEEESEEESEGEDEEKKESAADKKSVDALTSEVGKINVNK